VDLYSVDAQGRPQAVNLAAAGAVTAWDVTVTTNVANAQVVVQYPDLSAVPKSLALTLTDVDAGRTVNMRTTTGYSFEAGETPVPRHLRIEATARAAATLMLTGVTAQSLPESVGLTYSLSAPAEVEITVLNIAGRMIIVLPQGTQTSGTHSAAWSRRSSTGTRVPAGRYLMSLRCKAQDGTQVQQVVAATVR
jgi:hypothetical protein